MTTLPKTITTPELMEVDYKYHFTDAELRADWQRLCDTTEFKKGSQFKPGMKLCQQFFPNFWSITDARGRSFEKCWLDPAVMDKVRAWGLTGMSQLWLSWVRRAVYMAAGLPNSSFYRPHISLQAIRETGKETGILFDPCAGWGGRMLGTVAAGWKYIACEPNIQTYDNICSLVSFLGIGDMVTIHNTPVELLNFSSVGMVDAVLTSPPYFDLEKYSADTQQSYNKYPTYDSWKNEWLIPIVNQSLDIIAADGFSGWNVMNTGKIGLVDAVMDAHQSRGWNVSSTMGFDSPLANIRSLKNKDVTYLFRLVGASK